jgi:hypothetical protein
MIANVRMLRLDRIVTPVPTTAREHSAFTGNADAPAPHGRLRKSEWSYWAR